jgi:prophage regulatory protein
MDEFPVILRKNETGRRIGLSVRHLERLEAMGQFPPRVKLSGNSSGWVERDVRKWLEDRIATSQREAAVGRQRAQEQTPDG